MMEEDEESVNCSDFEELDSDKYIGSYQLDSKNLLKVYPVYVPIVCSEDNNETYDSEAPCLMPLSLNLLTFLKESKDTNNGNDIFEQDMISNFEITEKVSENNIKNNNNPKPKGQSNLEIAENASNNTNIINNNDFESDVPNNLKITEVSSAELQDIEPETVRTSDHFSDASKLSPFRKRKQSKNNNLSKFESSAKRRVVNNCKTYKEYNESDESVDESEYLPDSSENTDDEYEDENASNQENNASKPALPLDSSINSPQHKVANHKSDRDTQKDKVDLLSINNGQNKIKDRPLTFKERIQNLYPLNSNEPRSLEIQQNIPLSSDGGKYYYKPNFCALCNRKENRIDRHLLNHHMDVPEVALAGAMPAGSKERRDALSRLRLDANDFYNNNWTVNPKREILSSRRQRVKKKKVAVDSQEDNEGTPNGTLTEKKVSEDSQDNGEGSSNGSSIEKKLAVDSQDDNEATPNGTLTEKKVSEDSQDNGEGSSNQTLNKKKLKGQKYPLRMLCEICHAYLTPGYLAQHVRDYHPNVYDFNSRSILQNSKRNMGLCHKLASDQLRLEIFGHLKLDPTGIVVRYDELLVLYGNKYVKKYNGPDQRNYVKNHLRLLAKLQQEINKLQPDLKQLMQIFQAPRWPILRDAIDIVSQLDENTNKYMVIYNAETIPLLLRKCVKILKSEFTIRNDKKSMELLTGFEYVFENNVEFDISYRAIMSRKMHNRHTPANEIPNREEIHYFDNYVKTKIEISLNYFDNRSEELTEFSIKEEDKQHYFNLVECVPVNILLRNRRRNTEIGKTLILDYVHAIQVNPTSEFFFMLSKEEQARRLKYKKINIQGKRFDGQGALFITEENDAALKLIVKYRSYFGIRLTNPFLFAIKSKKEDRHVNVYLLMESLSRECADNYKQIDSKKMRCVRLRSQLATFNATFEQGQKTTMISKHLGHSDKVHHKHYKKAIDAEDLAVAEILEAAKDPGQSSTFKTGENSEHSDAECGSRQGQSNYDADDDTEENITRKSKGKIIHANKKDAECGSRQGQSNYDADDDTEENITRKSKGKIIHANKKDTRYGFEVEQSSYDTTGDITDTVKENIKRSILGKQNNNIDAATRKERIIRRSWNREEILAVEENFAENLRNRTYPSAKEIRNIIKTDIRLQRRTVKQIKTRISNRYNK